jgi:hypothetical protein
MSQNLSDKAMLVRLSISQWTARKYDKVVSDKVASDYGAGSEAGRYNKLLIAQEAIKKITKLSGDARTYHYAQTLPWDDSDARLLPAANYLPYTNKMRDFKGAFESAVRDFMAEYPALVADAQNRLNGMFSAADYPHISELPRRYAFNVAVSALAESGDFRVSLQESEIQAIRADIDMRMRDAQARAMRDLWQRLYDVTKHLADKLAEVTSDGKGGIFRDSLIENVSELCELLPRLNVMDDATLDDMRREVESKIAHYDPDTLRKDTATRQQVASDAQSILAAMAGYVS